MFTTQLIQTKRWLEANSITTFWLKTFIGATLLAIFAQISVPMYPVPITGQTLALTVVGFAMGRKAATAAVLLYLFEGAIGLPVFAGGASGFHHFFGPTGGYLLGYIPTAYFLGYYSDKGVLNSFWKVFCRLNCKCDHLCFRLGSTFFVPEGTVLQAGLYPFILGGVLKALLASVLVSPSYKFFSKL